MTQTSKIETRAVLRTRVLAVLHVLGAVGVLAFWIDFAQGNAFPREVFEKKIPHFDAFYAFEKAFAVPDLVNAFFMALAGSLLLVSPRSRVGRRILLAVSGALVFLTVLDLTYDLENDMYSVYPLSISLLGVPALGVLGLSTLFLLRDDTESRAAGPSAE